MVVEQFEKAGGKPVKVKCIGHFGIAVSGTNRYPGDVFETDEYTARVYVRMGRLAFVVEETPAPSDPAPKATEPGAGEDAGAGPPEPAKPGRRRGSNDE